MFQKMTSNLKIQVGGVYENGFGCAQRIVKAPTDKCRWFESELGDHYHEDGHYVSVRGGLRELNLLYEVKPRAEARP